VTSSTEERLAEGGARKGRPRDERIDRRITSAALEALAEDGFERFCVEGVAQRAEVAKTTIYRRFPTRDDLLAGALERLNEDLGSRRRNGSTRDQLLEALGAVRRAPGSLRGQILMHAAAEGERDPALAAFVHERVLAPRHALLRELIDSGIASGDLRPDIDPEAVIPVLVGPMLYLGMWRMRDGVRSIPDEDVVDLIIRGLTRATDS
jgi:AcrR family transcriptional regulator